MCDPSYARGQTKDRVGVDKGRMAEVGGWAGGSGDGWFRRPIMGCSVRRGQGRKHLANVPRGIPRGLRGGDRRDGGGERGPDSDRDGSVEATSGCVFWARLRFAFSMSHSVRARDADTPRRPR